MDKITSEKIEKYLSITEKALEIAKKAINPKNESEAQEILTMVSCYISDSKHFFKKKDFINAFAAINYAHGWLDCGARLRVFLVSDNKLFTI